MAGRRLNAEDKILWGRVAATVRPLKEPVAASNLIIGPQDEPKKQRLPKNAVLPVEVVTVKVQRASSSANTLDASWDKSIAKGGVAPDFTIDLHGETLRTAHARLNRSLATAIHQQARVILLITGKPAPDNPRLPPTSRGVIRASINDWLAASPFSGQIAAVRNAHPRHGGSGALYLILRRSR